MAQDQTDSPVTIQAHAVASHPKAQVIAVCPGESGDSKPKAKPTKKAQRLEEARTRAREWATSILGTETEVSRITSLSMAAHFNNDLEEGVPMCCSLN